MKTFQELREGPSDKDTAIFHSYEDIKKVRRDMDSKKLWNFIKKQEHITVNDVLTGAGPGGTVAVEVVAEFDFDPISWKKFAKEFTRVFPKLDFQGLM